MPPSNAVRCRCCGRFVAIGALPEHSAHCFTVESPVADDAAMGRLPNVAAHRTPLWRSPPAGTPVGPTPEGVAGARAGVTPSPQPDCAAPGAWGRMPPWAAGPSSEPEGSRRTPRGGRRASVAGWGSAHAKALLAQPPRRDTPGTGGAQQQQERNGVSSASPRRRRMTISSVIDAAQRERHQADDALAFMASILEQTDTYTKEFMSPDQHAEEVAEARSRRGSATAEGGSAEEVGGNGSGGGGEGPPTVEEMKALKAQLDATMRCTSMSSSSLERPGFGGGYDGDGGEEVGATARNAVAEATATETRLRAERERLEARRRAAEKQAAVDKAAAAAAASPAAMSDREITKLREQSMAMLRAGVISAEECVCDDHAARVCRRHCFCSCCCHCCHCCRCMRLR